MFESGRSGHPSHSGGIALARWSIALAIFLSFLFLDQINACLHNHLLVFIIFLSFSNGSALFLDLNIPGDLPSFIRAASTSLLNGNPPLGGVCNDSSNISSAHDRSSAKLLPPASGEHSSCLSRCPSPPFGLVEWYSVTAKPLAIGQESFTRVAFPYKRFVLIPELIPESMKVLIVWSMDI